MAESKDNLPALEKGKKTERLTATRIALLSKNVAKGWTKDRIVNYVKDQWGLSDTQASRYYYSAVRYLVPDDPEFKQSLVEKNIARLEQMIEDAMEAGERKEANDLIKTLNQMLGVAQGNKVTIGNRDDEGNQQVIEITFD